MQKNTTTNTHIEAGQNVQIGDNIHYHGVLPEKKPPRFLSHHVPQTSEGIIGRVEELAATKKLLHEGHAAVLFNGIGGIGKTTIAREFMVQYQADYDHLAWLTVQYSFAEAFINDAIFLKNIGAFDAVQALYGGGDKLAFEKAAMAQILAHLNALGNVLVVVDNANTFADLMDFQYLLEDATIDCIITSREKPDGWQMVEVKPLSVAECIEIFKKYAHLTDAKLNARRIAPKMLMQIVELLLRHTLLIELVARAVKENDIAVQDLVQALTEHSFHDEILNEIKIDAGRHSETATHQRRVAYISEYIFLIFKNITQISDDAQTQIKAFALLPPATGFTKAELLAHFALFGVKDKAWNTFTLQLLRRGWVEKDDKPEGTVYLLHPLIAQAVIHHFTVDTPFAADYIAQVTSLIYYDSTNTSHILSEKWQHQTKAERLADLFFDENREDISDFLDRLAYLFENYGFYQKAAAYKERALAIANSIFEPHHQTIAIRQSNLANVYGDLGRYAEAAHLSEQALASAIQNFGESHPLVAIHQSNLANVYRNLGRNVEAAHLLEQALASAIQNFGESHPSVATLQSNLANVYYYLGRYAEAAHLLEQALASDIQNFGKSHPSVATHQSNLANVYGNLGRNAEAAHLLEQALASDKQNFGESHPSVAIRQNNLANVYRDLGRNTEAAHLLEQALASDIQNFGESHPSIAIRQSNLANVYRNLGRNAEAAHLLEQALAADIQNFGESRPSVAIHQSNLANVYGDLGRNAEAAHLLEQALASAIHNFGESHPSVAIRQNNLAYIYWNLKRYDEAKVLWQQSYQTRLKVFGENHPHTQQVKGKLIQLGLL